MVSLNTSVGNPRDQMTKYAVFVLFLYPHKEGLILEYFYLYQMEVD